MVLWVPLLFHFICFCRSHSTDLSCNSTDESRAANSDDAIFLLAVRSRLSRDTGAAEARAMSTDHPEELVQVLTGTDTFGGGSVSDGNTLPQIKMPWGFNDWAPQTYGDGGSWWFHRSDRYFQGMRCTHQPSPWIGDYGHILLQPHTDDDPKDLEWSPTDSVFRPYLF